MEDLNIGSLKGAAMGFARARKLQLLINPFVICQVNQVFIRFIS